MFGISSNNVPTISSLDDCKKRFNRMLASLPRHRRSRCEWNESKLPLRDWKSEHMRIERDGSGEDERYKVYLYRTPVVEYYLDGRLAFDVNYGSHSTHAFFHAVSPGRWTTANARGSSFYICRDKWYAVTSTPLLVAADGETVLNPKDFGYTVEVSDKERRRELKAVMAPFVEWYSAMTRATGSMRSVLCSDDEVRLLGEHASQGRLKAHAELLGEGELTTDDQWRVLVSNAFVATVTYYARQNEYAYEATTWADDVLKKIIDNVWRQCGGYMDEKRVVKAGEKP